MRGWRTITAGITGLVLGAGLAVTGATSASAATTGHWGAFEVDGSGRAYTGSVSLPGFPETTFTSTSRQAAVVSGATTGQGPYTPPGAVYGNSRGNTYLNQRPSADQPNAASAAVTTYTFAGGTPGAGGWSFVLGDIDAVPAMSEEERADFLATLNRAFDGKVEAIGWGDGGKAIRTMLKANAVPHQEAFLVGAGVGHEVLGETAGLPFTKDIDSWFS